MLTQRLGDIDDEYIDRLLSMIKNNPGSCDEVWFSSLYGYPKPDTHAEYAERIIKQAEKFRNAGVRVSLQISNTVGHIVSTSRRDQIFNTVEYISGKPLPARITESFSSVVLPRVYKNGGLASVSIVNCMPGESGEYHIKVSGTNCKTAKYYTQYGKKAELPVGDDGVITMPSLLPWTLATVFFEDQGI